MKKEYPKFYSSQDIMEYYNWTSQGHWFSKDTMRFFGTRLNDMRKLSDTEYLFITTERNPSGVRKASIRIAKIKRDKSFCGFKIDIETLGDFHSMSLETAKRKMKNFKTETEGK